MDGFLRYVLEGPLLEPCQLDKDTIIKSIEEWKRLSSHVAARLGSSNVLDDVTKKRVLHYYMPIYFWIRQQILQSKKSSKQGPCVVAISAPQGCGKTTLVSELESLLEFEGLSSATVSIDDFYLTHSAQQELAETHSNNSLLQGRGHAGTHDLHLGTQTLMQLQASSGVVKIPRYDKSAFGGQGDRADEATWPEVKAPLDVVLFEGWMLGFRPIGDAAAALINPNLTEIDQRLREYKGAWDSFADAWLIVEVEDPKWVYQWRLQAEQEMRFQGKPGMSDKQVAAFVERYMPAYEAYLPQLYAQGPTTAQPGRTLFVQVDESRKLLGGRRLGQGLLGRLGTWSASALGTALLAILAGQLVARRWRAGR